MLAFEFKCEQQNCVHFQVTSSQFITLSLVSLPGWGVVSKCIHDTHTPFFLSQSKLFGATALDCTWLLKLSLSAGYAILMHNAFPLSLNTTHWRRRPCQGFYAGLNLKLGSPIAAYLPCQDTVAVTLVTSQDGFDHGQSILPSQFWEWLPDFTQAGLGRKGFQIRMHNF